MSYSSEDTPSLNTPFSINKTKLNEYKLLIDESIKKSKIDEMKDMIITANDDDDDNDGETASNLVMDDDEIDMIREMNVELDFLESLL